MRTGVVLVRNAAATMCGAGLMIAVVLGASSCATAQSAAVAVPSAQSSSPSDHSATTLAAVNPNAGSRHQGAAAKALDAAKSAVRQAGDILARVPCLPAIGADAAPSSLVHVAHKLTAGAPVTIVAFGSSSTQGYGASTPAFTYPSRLAEQLRRKYPASHINVINRGVGGQEVPQMLDRLQSSVLNEHPDLVIWQLGTNTVVRGSDISGTAAQVEDGIARMQAAGADVVLIDPQYVPAVTAKKDGASKMVKLIGDVARLKKISVFPRFEVMRHWHEDEKMPFDSFVISDGLHMNDWGYACFAQLLGDTIIKSVERVKTGVDAPAYAMRSRPM